jgi:transposase-like protein
LLVTAAVEPSSASVALVLQPTTVPVDPVAGGATSLTVQVTNTGTAPSDPVTVRLVSSGEILGVVEIETIAPSGSTSASISVPWPEGNPVAIEAVLVHKGELSSSQVSFEVVVPEAESTLVIPWSGIALGAAGGLALLTVEAIRRRSPTSSATSDPSAPSPSSPAAGSVSSAPVEKVEVACPACDRTLRVPSDYSGAVRCPDCSERFDVEPQTPVSASPSPQADKAEVDEVPEKVEIGCPACARSLRVPTSFNGRVRCPACKHEFSRAEAV